MGLHYLLWEGGGSTPPFMGRGGSTSPFMGRGRSTTFYGKRVDLHIRSQQTLLT